MSTTREELDSFQQFAEIKLAGAEAPSSLDELFTQWHDHQHRDEVNAAISRGLADVEAGRYRAAKDVIESIRQEFGFSKP